MSKSSTQVANIMEHSVIARMGERFGVDATKMVDTLKSTCFKSEKPITNEQLMALCVVADQYKLNPFTKEIYAYPDKKSSGIVPVVGVDGWIRIINEHPQYNGMSFNYSDEIVESEEHNSCNDWIECVIHRKDRDQPIVVREYFDECYQPPKGQYKTPGPWQSHTRRMLRHKALIQGGRLAFGFAGIYDPDEAERVIEGEVLSDSSSSSKPATRAPRQLNANPDPVTIDQQPVTVQGLSDDDIAKLGQLCVTNKLDPAQVLDHLQLDSFASLPLSRYAEVEEIINELGALD